MECTISKLVDYTRCVLQGRIALLRGLTGWRNGLMRTSWSLTLESANWNRITLYRVGTSDWKAMLQLKILLSWLTSS